MQSTALPGGQITPVRVVSSFERLKGIDALTVPEILRAILDHTAPPALTSAARVSRAWSTAALDKLWSDFDVKLRDLLLVFPLELTMYEVDDVPIPYWKLQRDPTDEEWTRFQSYASRIRSLSMPSGDIADAGLPRFDPSITKWKVKNDMLFPRLRRVEWSIPTKLPTLSPGLSSFTTSGLQELSLTILRGWWTAPEVVMSTLHDLTTMEGLRLKKFKLKAPDVDLNLGHAIADLITTQKDTAQTIELLASCPRVWPFVRQSLGNLTALDIHIPRGDGEAVSAIQALVEGCPRVSHLRMGVTAGVFDLDLPGLRATLGWQLLSFEAWSSQWLCVSKDDIADMARAWPKLKKLGLKCRRSLTGADVFLDKLVPSRLRTPLSRLVDIVSGFSELEELSADFFFDLNEGSGLSVASHIPSPIRCDQKKNGM
ncbi:hypothetical protein FRC04_011316 [Tulasnella sp. 424]|nr:hypothetical protein FRC04_011316 [Tulasnella sp. 424]KAG8975513.1 hypothetical protein FRC05_005582 [Tulasnella sp. 425]